MHEGGIPQSSSQAISMPAYLRKKALNTQIKIEYTCTWMMGKSPDVQFGIHFFNMERGIYLGKVGWNTWDFEKTLCLYLLFTRTKVESTRA